MKKRVVQWWQMAATMVAAVAVSAFGQVGNGSTGDYNYAPLTLVSTTTEYIDAGNPGVDDGTWQVKVDNFRNNTTSTLRIYANSYGHSNWQYNPPFQIGGQYAVQPGETFSFRATWSGDGPGWPMGVNGWQKITQIDVQAPPSATLTLTIVRAGTVTIKQGGTTHGSLTNTGSGTVAQSFTLPTGTYTLEATAGSNHTQGDWSGAGLSGNSDTATLSLMANTSVSKTFLATLTELGFTIQSRTYQYTGGQHSLIVDASLNDGQYTLTASPSPFQSPAGTQTGDKTLSATNVGTYTATATPVSPYTGPAVTGTLTIQKADPIITWNPQPITYGTPLGANQLNATATFVLANGSTYTVPGSFSYNPPAGHTQASGAVLAAGTHTLTGSFTSTDGNFNSVGSISATLTVAKATLTVTGSSHSREFKAANPSFSVSYSGFVNSESAANLTTQPTASTTATASSPIGDYNVTPAGGVSNNYTFNTVAGRLTITRKPVTFSFGNLSNQRTGASFTATVTPSDAETTYTSALSYGPAVGDYPVSATATGNYSGSGSATATVTQEAPDVSASISSSVTSANAPGAATITWSSSNATSVSVTGNGLSSAQGSGSQGVSGLAAGTYTYTITAQGKNGPAVQTSTVTIAAAQPNVTAAISANPSSTNAPGTATITWSSSNATSVAVSGPSLNSTALSGSQQVTGLAAGTHTYTITAQGSGGPVTRQATVTVTQIAVDPPSGTVDATLVVEWADRYNAAMDNVWRVTWTTKNATSVLLTVPAGTGLSNSTAASGSVLTGVLGHGSYEFVLVAQGQGGPVTRRAVAWRYGYTGGRNASLEAAPSNFTNAGGTTRINLDVDRAGPGVVRVTYFDAVAWKQVQVEGWAINPGVVGRQSWNWTVPPTTNPDGMNYTVVYEGGDEYGGYATANLMVAPGVAYGQTVVLTPATATAAPGQTVTFSASGGNTGYVWSGTTASAGASGQLTVPSNAVAGAVYPVAVYSREGATGGRVYNQSNTATARVTVAVPRPTASLTPIASELTINNPESPLHGRTYPRLWNESGWTAYLGRAGVTFEVAATGSPAVRTLTLEARSPQTGWTTLATQTVGTSAGSASHRFSVTLGEVVPGEPLIPASFKAGTPDTGVWHFRARAEDSTGTWSDYSPEVPVNVLLPVVSRSVSGQTVPPVGPTGDWFTASSVTNFSFVFWIP